MKPFPSFETLKRWSHFSQGPFSALLRPAAAVEENPDVRAVGVTVFHYGGWAWMPSVWANANPAAAYELDERLERSRIVVLANVTPADLSYIESRKFDMDTIARVFHARPEDLRP